MKMKYELCESTWYGEDGTAHSGWQLMKPGFPLWLAFFQDKFTADCVLEAVNKQVVRIY